jgi:hypothetical protein
MSDQDQRIRLFFQNGRRLADEAEALGGEMSGWEVHYAVRSTGHRLGLTETEILLLMEYEDDKDD